jgi:hypothetical protein
LADYLEKCDILLADKEFPEIEKVLDESGKEIGIHFFQSILKLR